MNRIFGWIGVFTVNAAFGWAGDSNIQVRGTHSTLQGMNTFRMNGMSLTGNPPIPTNYTLNIQQPQQQVVSVRTNVALPGMMGHINNRDDIGVPMPQGMRNNDNAGNAVGGAGGGGGGMGGAGVPPAPRKPKDVAEGLKGPWSGLLAFTGSSTTNRTINTFLNASLSPDAWEKTTGSAAGLPIAGARPPKYESADGLLELDLFHKPAVKEGPQPVVSVVLKGKVSADWTTITGEFQLRDDANRAMFGAGKFKLIYGSGHEYYPGSAEWADVPAATPATPAVPPVRNTK